MKQMLIKLNTGLQPDQRGRPGYQRRRTSDRLEIRRPNGLHDGQQPQRDFLEAGRQSLQRSCSRCRSSLGLNTLLENYFASKIKRVLIVYFISLE